MARKFDLILFDADGTLFDFAASERVAFEACLEAALGVGNYAEAHRVYVELSAALWRRLEQGTITGPELCERRWLELSERCQLEYSVREISEAYVKELSRHAHEIEGALDICRALAVEHQLGIVTNGFEAIQSARLASSSLSPFFAFMVTSEAAGAGQPAPLEPRPDFSIERWAQLVDIVR